MNTHDFLKKMKNIDGNESVAEYAREFAGLALASSSGIEDVLLEKHPEGSRGYKRHAGLMCFIGLLIVSLRQHIVDNMGEEDREKAWGEFCKETVPSLIKIAELSVSK